MTLQKTYLFLLLPLLALSSCSSAPSKAPLVTPKLLDTGVLGFTLTNSTKVIDENTYYTNIEDVAGYVMGFKKLPKNYHLFEKQVDATICLSTYGADCRLYKDPYHNEKNSTKYTSPYLEDGASHYFEADISSPNGGYSTSARGIHRIVFSTDVDHEILYYTNDHYENFRQYYNYHQGWGAWFGNGQTKDKGARHEKKAKWEEATYSNDITYIKTEADSDSLPEVK